MKILLTGEPGIGKSTVCKKFLDIYSDKVYGVTTKRMKDKKGFNHGFKAVKIDGKEKIIAHRELVESELLVGNDHKVDTDTIDNFIVPEISKGLRDKDGLILVDEIGRMQSFSKKFLMIIDKILKSDANILATIVQDPEPWSLPFKYNPKVILIEVTEINRDHLPTMLNETLTNAILFDRLPNKKQKTLNLMLKKYLDSGNLLLLNKLIHNAIPYVLTNKIITYPTCHEVIGKHGKYKVSHNNHSEYTCTCDLFNGRKEYRGRKGDCSHIQTIKIFTS